jgi:hypothetical protein
MEDLQTPAGIVDDPQPACPHLGFDRDPRTRGRIPQEQHRCFAVSPGGSRIRIAAQARYCLSAYFSECPVLAVGGELARPPVLLAGDTSSTSGRRGAILLVSLALAAAAALLAGIAMVAATGGPAG